MSLAGRAALLPLASLVPLVGAVVALVVGRLSARAAALTAAGVMVATGALLAVVAPPVYRGHVLVHHLGRWAPVGGTVLGISWACDPFGLTFALTVCAVITLIALWGVDELGGFGPQESGQVWCLVLLLAAGLIGTGLTGDLFNLFVWFEVASVASYGLAAFHLERPSSLEAAFKLAVLMTVAGFLVFIGIGLLYGEFGALNFGQLHTAMAARHGDLGWAGATGVALLIAGLATKAGLVPFHAWLPDAHSAAPGPVSALFSGVMVAMGLVAIARIVASVVPAGALRVHGSLVVLGVTSALVGGALAYGQDDLKRLLAYDTVAQMGFIAVDLGVGSPKGDAAAIWHIANHGAFKTLLFVVAGGIVHLTGRQQLSELGGIGRRYRALGVLFVVGIAAIIGLPPLNGYASRVLAHGALVDSHQYVTLGLVELAEVLSAAALLRAAWSLWFAPSPGDQPIEPKRLRRPTMAVVGALGGACLVFGLAPARWLSGMAGPAAAVLAHPERYASALTAGHLTDHAMAIGQAPVPGSFVSSEVLISTAAVVIFGVAAAAWRIGHHDPAPIRLLRRLHSGSVNDYATYLALGVIGLVVVLGR